MTTTSPDRPTGQEIGGGSRWAVVRHALNTRYHHAALTLFSVMVVAHWAEHLAQAAQIYLLGWPRPAAGGVLGLVWQSLVTSEWMHYGYAVVMLVAFFTLRHGFSGRARRWWDAALWIQFWHHIEHFLLLVQAVVGANLLGGDAPSSIAQLIFPRVELHLFYNTIVTVPMVVAMVVHRRGHADPGVPDACRCAAHRTPVAVGA